MIVLIDNYDSFSYNLYQLIGSQKIKGKNLTIKVIRNDELNLEQIEALNPKMLVISPGPKAPKDAGISMDAITYFAPKIPIFGVCLGHQCIAEAFGGVVSYAKSLMHAKTSLINITKDSILFKGLKSPLSVARYHSLSIKELPNCLEVLALSDDGEIMAIKHKKYETFGVQFHPESILTQKGEAMICNLLKEFL